MNVNLDFDLKISLYLDVFSPQNHWCDRGYDVWIYFGICKPDIKCVSVFNIPDESP